jgi:cellulose synthase operon protein C
VNTRLLSSRARILGLLCTLLWAPPTVAHAAQTEETPTAQLLGKAHALELRGRIDMARQTWAEVLQTEPDNAEALAGLARAAVLQGRKKEAAADLARLRKAHPDDPAIAQIQTMTSGPSKGAQLREAEQLAQSGEYLRAMADLRQIYGVRPPPGDLALVYYSIEGALEDDRPQAVAGLRLLADKYPDDARYRVALGRVLTYNPRTREEGRELLEENGGDAAAAETLRQSLLWNSERPATTAEVRAYLMSNPGGQSSPALSETALSSGPAPVASAPAISQPPTAASARAATPLRLHMGNTPTVVAETANPPASNRTVAAAVDKPSDVATAAPAPSVETADKPVMVASVDKPSVAAVARSVTAPLEKPVVVSAQRPVMHAVGYSAAESHDAHFRAAMETATSALADNHPSFAREEFQMALRRQPSSPTAWRGLLAAECAEGDFNGALAVDARMPGAAKAQLGGDALYLKSMGSVYAALGRTTEAQRLLALAMTMPLDDDQQRLQIGIKLQYAALLDQAGDKPQAAVLYKQVLAADNSVTPAWEALVEAKQAAGRDAEALETAAQMPAASRAAAMADENFVTVIASIELAQGQASEAQSELENLLAGDAAKNKKPSSKAQLQLAGIYRGHGDAVRAYVLYHAVVASTAASAEAWRGLLETLHATEHDDDALRQLEKMPPAVRAELERDPAFLRNAAAIYAGVHDSQNAVAFMDRADKIDASMNVTPPTEAALLEAGVLYNSGNEAGLYHKLMTLGGRSDLTDEQRRNVQTVWVNWTLRRADESVRAGDHQRSTTILSTAAKIFPDSHDLLRAEAKSYTNAGQPKLALALFQAQDLARAQPADYGAAVNAAMAADDMKNAETWLRAGLAKYPHDPEILQLGGKFEERRKHATLAAEYYKASAAAKVVSSAATDVAGAPPKAPSAAPVAPVHLPDAQQGEELAKLLSVRDPSQTPTVSRGSAMALQSRRTLAMLPESGATR